MDSLNLLPPRVPLASRPLGVVGSALTARRNVLADALEALLGALYLDGGLDAARRFLRRAFAPLVDEGRRPPLPAKSRLQEWLQARQKGLPVYELVSETGDDHAKLFRVRCSVADPAVTTEGEGTSRRLAEQQAAATAIERLDSK